MTVQLHMTSKTVRSSDLYLVFTFERNLNGRNKNAVANPCDYIKLHQTLHASYSSEHGNTMTN
eukprot:scaffold92405_cov20-Prasinocladus_malaysianus.AAC.1